MSIPFAIVGGGWRARFYLRIARELPDRFRVTGLLTRNPERAVGLEKEFRVPAVRTLDALLADRPMFVVLVVPWAVTPAMMAELVGRRVAVLSETPPAPDLGGLRALRSIADGGSPVQVAEQYQFQPLHAARLAIARSGRLGTVSQTQLSVAHGYHGVDLLRRLLGVEFEGVTITARSVRSPIVAGPDRHGPPAEERIVESDQLIGWLEFDGGRFGVLDFSEDQYFSWIRSPRALVRGERGEIHDTTVRFLRDAQTPVRLELMRHDAGADGNLEGLYHKGITAGDEWVYRNPFGPARLTDDELAVATCLERMAEHVLGGPSFCSLAEAVHDHHLSLLVSRSAETGQSLRADGHLWDRSVRASRRSGRKPQA